VYRELEAEVFLAGQSLKAEIARHNSQEQKLGEQLKNQHELLQSYKIGHQKHLEVVATAEKLSFENEALRQEVDTLKAKLAEPRLASEVFPVALSDQPLPSPDSRLVTPKRPKKVVERARKPRVQDVVVLESSVKPKRKTPAPAKTDAGFRKFLREKKAKEAKKRGR
jgi:hypothetical protein